MNGHDAEDIVTKHWDEPRVVVIKAALGQIAWNDFETGLHDR
jgi:hypothetical protein